MGRLLLLAVVLATTLSGCKWFKSTSKDNVDEPTPLAKIESSTGFQRLWSIGVSDDKGRSGSGLRPAVAGDRVFLAGTKGELMAVSLATGKRIWDVKAKGIRHSGGPGSDGRRVVIGALDGEVLAYDAADGELLWQTQVSAEVLAAPLVTANMVVVRSNDGRVHGLDAATGSVRWANDGDVPLLSLRGNASPLLEGEVVVIAADNGKVRALGLADGRQRWEQAVNVPEGRNELDRLIDLDGQLRADRGDIFLSAYNGSTMALIGDSGAQLWAVEVPSVSGLDIDAQHVVVAQSDGVVRGLDRRSGAELWKQEALKFRQLGAPLVLQDWVVVSDMEGWMHALDKNDGRLVGRERLGKARLSGPPQLADGIVVAQDIRGRVAAWRLGSP